MANAVEGLQSEVLRASRQVLVGPAITCTQESQTNSTNSQTEIPKSMVEIVQDFQTKMKESFRYYRPESLAFRGDIHN